MVFLIPLGFIGSIWWVVQNFLFIIFLLVFRWCLWGQIRCLGYNFWFDSLSYSLVLLSVWVIILIIMAREKVLFSSFYNVSFIRLVLVLLFLLWLSFISSSLFIFYLFFEGLWFLVGGISQSECRRGFIYYYILCWRLCLCWLVSFILGESAAVLFFIICDILIVGFVYWITCDIV